MCHLASLHIRCAASQFLDLSNVCKRSIQADNVGDLAHVHAATIFLKKLSRDNATLFHFYILRVRQVNTIRVFKFRLMGWLANSALCQLHADTRQVDHLFAWLINYIRVLCSGLRVH
jgi:hypothetical protein